MSFSEIGTSGATSPLLRSSDGRSSKPIRVRIRSPSDRPLLRLVPVSPSCIVSPRLDQLVQRGLGWIFWATAFYRIDWPLRRRSDFLSERSSTNIDGNRRESTSSSGVRWIGLIPAAGPGLRLCPGTSSAPQTSGVTHTRLKYLTPRRTKKPSENEYTVEILGTRWEHNVKIANIVYYGNGTRNTMSGYPDIHG